MSVLRFAFENHAVPEDWRPLIREQVIARSVHIVNSAFARLELAYLRSHHLKPAELPARHRLKIAVARLPEPAAKTVARALISMADFSKACRGFGAARGHYSLTR